MAPGAGTGVDFDRQDSLEDNNGDGAFPTIVVLGERRTSERCLTDVRSEGKEDKYICKDDDH